MSSNINHRKRPAAVSTSQRDNFDSLIDGKNSQDDDDEDTIAGIVMVTRATNAEVAGDFREGRIIEPQPIVGTVNVTQDKDMSKELTGWFQKGAAASNMSKSTDSVGYTDNWYSDISQDDVKEEWGFRVGEYGSNG